MALGARTRVPAPATQRKLTRGVGFDERRGVFLRTEAEATARLGAMYAQLRRELQLFLGRPDLSASDQAFYAELYRQADLRLKAVQTQAQTWVDQVIPSGFVSGVELQGQSVILQPIHDQALRFLSGYTLDLIQDTSEDVRRTIQQEVGQAVAGSISRQQLVERLIGSGLTAGPWADVETRAMVIARTETMRAYNAGNVAGIRSNGAVLGRWITSRDERVCGICGPRDGQTFVLPGVTEAELVAAGAKPGVWVQLDAVTARGTDSAPPAHPRCRCTLRAQYRDADGKLLGDPDAAAANPATPEAAAAVDPADLAKPELEQPFDDALVDVQTPAPSELEWERTTRPQLMIDKTLAEIEYRNMPVNVMQDAVDRAAFYTNRITPLEQALRAGAPIDAARAAYWRALDLTPSRISAIAALPGKAGQAGFAGVLRYRYGIRTVAPTRGGFPEEIRAGWLRSLEIYRGKRPELVTDSAWLKVFGDDGFSSRMSGGELGTYNGIESIRVNVGRMSGSGEYQGRGKLRGGPDVDVHEEIMTHEIGHSIWQAILDQAGGAGAYRTGGLRGQFGQGPSARAGSWISEADAKVAYREWLEIKAKTDGRKVAPFAHGASPEAAAEIASLKERIEQWHRDEVGIRGIVPDAEYQVLKRNALDRMRERIDDLERGPDGSEHHPSGYGRDGNGKSGASGDYSKRHEDFAETIMLYVTNPAKLRAYSPARYAFIRRWVFDGREYLP